MQDCCRRARVAWVAAGGCDLATKLSANTLSTAIDANVGKDVELPEGFNANKRAVLAYATGLIALNVATIPSGVLHLPVFGADVSINALYLKVGLAAAATYYLIGFWSDFDLGARISSQAIGGHSGKGLEARLNGLRESLTTQLETLKSAATGIAEAETQRNKLIAEMSALRFPSPLNSQPMQQFIEAQVKLLEVRKSAFTDDEAARLTAALSRSADDWLIKLREEDSKLLTPIAVTLGNKQDELTSAYPLLGSHFGATDAMLSKVIRDFRVLHNGIVSQRRFIFYGWQGAAPVVLYAVAVTPLIVAAVFGVLRYFKLLTG